MRLFTCQYCGTRLHFENTRCLGCGHALGFLPGAGLIAIIPAEDVQWRPAEARGGRPDPLSAPDLLRFCANWEKSACNWLLDDAAGPGALCRACCHNRVIPDLADPAAHALWQKLEAAKRRLIYSLMRLGLPLPYPGTEDDAPLAFDFPADAPGEPAMTGHASGLVTIALAEAADEVREARRGAMGEPYRTLLGHFRHEVGHFYWDRLIRDTAPSLEACRALFGDDSADYGEALDRHYENGPPSAWQDTHVSAYATAHAWEDWAETFAHYLHIVDSLEMAEAFGVFADGAAAPRQDPYTLTEIAPLIDAWVPLSMAVNGLNRAMGQPDLYPFVLNPPVIEKLAFVQAVVQDARQSGSPVG